MGSFHDIWNKFRNWCRLVILIHEGGESVCKDILSKMGIKDLTNGAEIYRKLKPYEERIKKLTFYQQKALLPDDEVIDTTKMKISLLSTHIIQILDTSQSYPQITVLRHMSNELFHILDGKKDLTEQIFDDYWKKISQLLTGLHFNMELIKGLKTEDYLSQEHEKTLKEITENMKGRIDFQTFFINFVVVPAVVVIFYNYQSRVSTSLPSFLKTINAKYPPVYPVIFVENLL